MQAFKMGNKPVNYSNEHTFAVWEGVLCSLAQDSQLAE